MKSVLKTTTNRKEFRKAFLKEEFPPYWDEGLHLYPACPRWKLGENHGGARYRLKKKKIMSYQKRMYKTWKHNRKTQWKKACMEHANTVI